MSIFVNTWGSMSRRVCTCELKLQNVYILIALQISYRYTGEHKNIFLGASIEACSQKKKNHLI